MASLPQMKRVAKLQKQGYKILGAAVPTIGASTLLQAPTGQKVVVDGAGAVTAVPHDTEPQKILPALPKVEEKKDEGCQKPE